MRHSADMAYASLRPAQQGTTGRQFLLWALDHCTGAGQVGVTFQDWTKDRTVPNFGTNTGAPELPFQGWRRFKEAFAPELIAKAVRDSRVPVKACLDPFGGSGTTALACQFLGVKPITIEVNPYLADLIEAKLSTYDVDNIARDHGRIVRIASANEPEPEAIFTGAPPTFLEPGLKDRYIFCRSVAAKLAAYRCAIETIKIDAHRRLFRVLLGSVAIMVSNVVVSGKGRRYREGWRNRPVTPDLLDKLFAEHITQAVGDIRRFASRAERGYRVHRGDSRELIETVEPVDLAVFSPPYPNSFDYTDVYNVELWTLGYLTGSEANRDLREATLSSHVQILRKFEPAPEGSKRLTKVINALVSVREQLWNPHIPEMVGG